MIKAVKIILAITAIFICTVGYAADSGFKTVSSDSVGVKLECPNGWRVDKYKWGFTITEPVTTSTVSVQVYFMPAEMEPAYDINMNEDFSRIYGDAFESVGEGEKEISDTTWDFTIAHGAIGTPMEYQETTYSVLIENSVYTIEEFVFSTTPDDVKSQMDKAVESVKLMYKESELPALRKYREEWLDAGKENKKIEHPIASGAITLNYSPPWMFSGSGASTEASMHYLSGNPYQDIDMIILLMPDPNPENALNNVQTIVEIMTTKFTLASDETIKIGNSDATMRKLTQGSGEDLIHTRFYVMKKNNQSLVLVFAYHDQASFHADEKIDELIDGLEIGN